MTEPAKPIKISGDLKYMDSNNPKNNANEINY